MEDFINYHSERIFGFKKNVLTQRNAAEFLEKIIKKEKDKVLLELKKLLLASNDTDGEKKAKEKYIKEFIEALNNLPKDLTSKTEQSVSNDDSLKKSINLTNSNTNKPTSSTANTTSTTAKPANKAENFEWGKKFKIKNIEEEFPELSSMELVDRKKNYRVLDQHYENKLEKGIKVCNCMSKKHPLVGNCLNCGRIQCLQEGDKECIYCGVELLLGKEYQKKALADIDMKKAIAHKDKLLKFQENFYSKLQIIDDFSDWYDLSNNTWLDKENRELAKRNDREIDRIRDSAEFEWKVDFRNMTIEKEYETVDDQIISKDINAFYIEEMKRNKENKLNETKKVMKVEEINKKCIEDFSALIAKNKEMKCSEPCARAKEIEHTRVDISSKDKFGTQLLKYKEKELKAASTITEHDNFMKGLDTGVCLSMHQPWASLVIEGLKRFEGREWSNDYRGILWIHAAAKKPDDDIIKAVENEYRELYKGCENIPFPSSYPTSVLLGCVDLVDIISLQDYKTMIPDPFKEKTSSEFQFVVKNPCKLDYPIKMSGDHKLFSLEKDSLERTRDRLTKVKTNWWPHPNIRVNLTEPMFKFLVSDNTAKKGTSKDPKSNNKFKYILNVIENPEKFSMILQNFIKKEKIDTILAYIDTMKTKMKLSSCLTKESSTQYGLELPYLTLDDVHPAIMDLFEEFNTYSSKENKIKKSYVLEEVKIEYFDLYGIQSIRKASKKEIKIIIGNSIILSVLKDFSDFEPKSIKLDSTNILVLDEGLYYSIPQVMYDGGYMKAKLKQGTLIITLRCN